MGHLGPPPPPKRLTKFCFAGKTDFRIMANFSGYDNANNVQFQEASPLTKGFAPGPRWKLCPYPVIGWRSALAMCSPNSGPESASEGCVRVLLIRLYDGLS